MASHRKCMLILRWTFEQNYFEIFLAGQAVLHFKIVCNSIHELLNVFEDLAQRVHTIGK